MNLFVRIAIYVPVLFLIAIVVVGQHHATGAETLRSAAQRTVRWVAWSAALVAAMLVLELIIGW